MFKCVLQFTRTLLLIYLLVLVPAQHGAEDLAGGGQNELVRLHRLAVLPHQADVAHLAGLPQDLQGGAQPGLALIPQPQLCAQAHIYGRTGRDGT